MKIIFFMEGYYLGGPDTFVINLINNWPVISDQLTLICNRKHTGLEWIESAITRPCTIIKHNMVIFTGFFELTKRKIDYIINFPLKLLGPILRYVFLTYNICALKRILLQENGDRLMIINGGYPGGDSCRAASITWGIFSKRPYSIHNFHGVVLKAGWHIILQEYLADVLVSRFTKAFVTVSRAAAESMSCRKGIYKRSKILYIYNGIEILNSAQKANSIGATKPEIDMPITNPLCLMLGAYHRHKNFDKGHYFLLQAFKKVVNQIPAAKLIICGYGSNKDMDKVRRLVLKFDIKQNVYLSGFRKDISSLLGRTDVLLISSQVFESFCLAGIEAMAHRVPVVATKVGALPEVVVDNEGGYCVEKDDVDSYADCIIKLLRDDNLRKKQGQKGFQRYKRLFTATRMAKEYARLIQNG